MASIISILKCKQENWMSHKTIDFLTSSSAANCNKNNRFIYLKCTKRSVQIEVRFQNVSKNLDLELNEWRPSLQGFTLSQAIYQFVSYSHTTEFVWLRHFRGHTNFCEFRVRHNDTVRTFHNHIRIFAVSWEFIKSSNKLFLMTGSRIWQHICHFCVRQKTLYANLYRPNFFSRTCIFG